MFGRRSPFRQPTMRRDPYTGEREHRVGSHWHPLDAALDAQEQAAEADTARREAEREEQEACHVS